VEGTNFFTELAPCVNNGLVYGRFREGVAAGDLDTEMNYALTYRMRPVLAQMRLWRDAETATNWVLLKRIGMPGK
jgi:photoactive yellow protein